MLSSCLAQVQLATRDMHVLAEPWELDGMQSSFGRVCVQKRYLHYIKLYTIYNLIYVGTTSPLVGALCNQITCLFRPLLWPGFRFTVPDCPTTCVAEACEVSTLASHAEIQLQTVFCCLPLGWAGNSAKSRCVPCGDWSH